jgi:hypothetical protein
MPTLTDNTSYVFAFNDVYEIQAGDNQEGEAIGASNGGIGLSNVQAQTLTNKARWLYDRLVGTDEPNISELLAFQGFFAGLMGQNGWLRLYSNDEVRGVIAPLLQWGYYAPGGGVVGDDGGKVSGLYPPYVVTWTVAFPNACVWAAADMVYPNNSSPDFGVGVQASGGAPLLNKNNGSFFVNLFNVNGSAPGFMWLAIGY